MIYRMWAAVLSALLAAWALGGCAQDSAGSLRMDISGPVLNLDPQFTDEPDARMILLNIGEGLMSPGTKGPRPGVARSIEISEDGMTYVFTLREDALWEDGKPVVAGDFVFSFRRMFSPGALSPHAEDFTMIKGAKNALEGMGAAHNIGVESDGDSTVTFRLEHPCAEFLDLLATVPALPCREDIFLSSKGRYGLEREFTPSSGPFRLERWDNSRYLQLGRNPSYSSPLGTAKPERITLYTSRERPLNQFLDGKSDLLSVPSGQEGQLEGKARLIRAEDKIWAVVFNQRDPLWGNPLLRQALAHALEPGVFGGDLPAHLSESRMLIPPGVTINATNHRELAGEGYPLGFDPARSLYLLETVLASLDLSKLPETALHVPEEMRSVTGPVLQGWRQRLDINIHAQSASPEQIAAMLDGGGYQLLLTSFSPSGSGPDAFLSYFASDSERNRFGYRNPRFDTALESARKALSAEDATGGYAFAEQLLLSDAAVLPLYLESALYALSPELSGVEILPFGGGVLFRDAVK